MKKFVFLAAALACVSCFQINPNFSVRRPGDIKGEGPVVSKDLAFADFHSIILNGGAEVKFVQAEEWKVTLKTQENIFDSLDYKVEDSTFVIQIKNHREVRAEEYSLTIQAPDLRLLEVNGAADFEMEKPFRSEGDVEIEISGAGDLDLSGEFVCRNLSIQVNGAADLEAEALDVAKVKVQINGAGDATLKGKASEADFEVNGAGDIDARSLSVSGKVRKQAAGLAKIRL